VSFVFGRDIYRLQSIERYTRSVIRRERIPSQEQVEGRRADLIFDALRERLESGKFDAYQDNIDRLLENGHTPTDIAGALVTLLREASGREGSAIEEDREPERRDPREAGKQRKGPKDKPDRERPAPGDRPHREGPPFERPPREGGPAPRFERGDRRDRGESSEEMVSLFLSLGKTHGILPKEIVGMLYREAGLPDGCLGRISLFPRHSLVDVPQEFVRQVIDRTRSARLKGQPFRIDVDRGPGRY